jgi:hypothetical protein
VEGLDLEEEASEVPGEEKRRADAGRWPSILKSSAETSAKPSTVFEAAR